MATERQLAANRRNAIKSTGPKTSTGKRRASTNSYRHGLSVQTDDGQNSHEVEALAQRMIGDFTDEGVLQYARSAARAHFDLVRVRQIKADILNRMIDFGSLERRPFRFRSLFAELRFLKRQPFDQPVEWPPWVDPLGPMPLEEEERAAEAVRRLLPELRKLSRYEARAHAIKFDAIRKISLRMPRFKIQS
ncbi:hypothetical protein ACO2JO_04340 [Leptospira interrogans]